MGSSCCVWPCGRSGITGWIVLSLLFVSLGLHASDVDPASSALSSWLLGLCCHRLPLLGDGEEVMPPLAAPWESERRWCVFLIKTLCHLPLLHEELAELAERLATPLRGAGELAMVLPRCMTCWRRYGPCRFLSARCMLLKSSLTLLGARMWRKSWPYRLVAIIVI